MSAFPADQINEVFRQESELRLRPYLVREEEERIQHPKTLRCPLIDLLPPYSSGPASQDGELICQSALTLTAGLLNLARLMVQRVTPKQTKRSDSMVATHGSDSGQYTLEQSHFVERVRFEASQCAVLFRITLSECVMVEHHSI